MSTALLPPWRDDWALFLDVDGTLLEIAPTPAAVTVPARAIELLAQLRDRLSGALALVSGRTLADLDRLWSPLRVAMAGAHGAERRSASGIVQRYGDGSALAPARQLLGDWVRAHAGALLEDKKIALALHFRQVPELELEARRVVADVASAMGPRFCVQDGKRVLEIKEAATDKGQAIAAFMAEEPFAGRIPVFVGDDLTDEDGFARVNLLGGHSIAVGARRHTEARWRLADERQVLEWLETNARKAAS
jgi:trehalose 6-phosphate phosphatase